jgi:uncharacterized protein
MKFGIWIVIGVIAWLWFNGTRKQQLRERERANERAAAARGAQPGTAVERMVGCAHCGLHVPASDAVVTVTGTGFCSEAHRRLHPSA